MKKYMSIKYVAYAVLLGFLPLGASAATVYLESSRTNIAVGDTVVVSAKIDAQGATVNTVEGNIAVKSGAGNIVVQEFSLANSILGLWPRTPSLSTNGQTVSFVGGVPGGFNIEGATLFKIIFQAKKEGSVALAPQGILVHANDGKGTTLPVQLKSLVITVGAKEASATDDWGAVVARDTTPPEDFIIVLGQDKALFNGSKFAYFSAVDNQSGISYYEVSENGAPAVRSGSTYVLQNQNEDVTLSVTAVDKAGNKKVSNYSMAATPNSVSNNINWVAVGIAVVLLVIVIMVIKKKKNSKNNAPTMA
jgi:hypothetical protein